MASLLLLSLILFHRDIKPSNVMITAKGLAKIMDFGLVKFKGSDSASMTMAGTLLGTVNYLSPEQGRGEECDKRSDIYSLGIVLYQLLTGRLPFAGDNPGSVIYQHNFVEPTAPREINPDIPKYHQAIVLKAMQKKADDRYQDPREIIADIDLIKKWKPPKTEKTSVNPSVFLADESLTKSSEFSSDLTEAGKSEPEKSKSEKNESGASEVRENKALGNTHTEFVAEPRKKSSQWILVIGIVIPVIIGMAVFYKLNTTRDGLVPLYEAKQLLADGKYLQCRDIVDGNLAITPDDHDWKNLNQELNRKEGENLFKIAKLQFARGKFVASRETAARILEFLPDDVKVKKFITRLDEQQVSFKNARQLLQEGKYAECRSLVKEKLNASPDDLNWKELYRQLNGEEGANLLRSAKSGFYTRSYDVTRGDLIFVLELLPDNNQAQKLLDQLDKRDHALKLARKLLLEEAFSQCRDVVSHNVATDPNDPVWIGLESEIDSKEGIKLLNRTKSEFEQNNYESARVTITRALEMLPDNQEVKQLYSALIDRDRDYSLAQQLLKAGNFGQCRDLIDRHLSISSKDHDWLTLRITLNTQEGQGLLLAIRRDIDNNDYNSADIKLDEALQLSPDDRELLDVKEKLKRRSTTLKKVDQLIERKEFSQCRQLLEKQLDSNPEDPQWLVLWNELNQKEVQHKMLLAKYAYNKEKYSTARRLVMEILDVYTEREDVRELLDQIDQNDPSTRPKIKERVQDRNEFTSISKNSQNAVNDQDPSSASYDGSGIQTYPFDNKRNIAGRLNLLRRMLDDKSQAIDNLEEAISDFIGDVGKDQEDVPELQRRLQDRQAEENIINTLASLDKAVIDENRDQLASIVKVKEHVAALTSLMGQPGLVFRHHIHSFNRKGDKAIIKVVLNHALLYMAATDIYYRYEAQRKGYRWIITSVQMLDRLD